MIFIFLKQWGEKEKKTMAVLVNDSEKGKG